jgi:hypothetical protein
MELEEKPPKMKILVLGHGREYSKEFTRCSFYDIDKWFDSEYTCVDIDPSCKPDIVADLRYKWDFAKDDEYNLIIDTTGIVLTYTVKGTLKCKPLVEHEVMRCLKIGGEFYGRRQIYLKKEAPYTGNFTYPKRPKCKILT